MRNHVAGNRVGEGVGAVADAGNGQPVPVREAGAEGGRTRRGVQGASNDEVHQNVKVAFAFMDTVSHTMVNTPAERERQRRHMTWQSFRHGLAVVFCTPNLDTSSDPILMALATGPGEGTPTDEPVSPPGVPLVRLGPGTGMHALWAWR